MDQEVKEFTEAIGAVEPEPSDENYSFFRSIFKKQNYFLFEKGYMMVHLSRSKTPFWGFGKKFSNLLNGLEDWYLVLLVNNHEGWVFDKHEINSFIENGRWKLREVDDNYKINPPLPDKNSFLSPRQFLEIVGIGKK